MVGALDGGSAGTASGNDGGRDRRLGCRLRCSPPCRDIQPGRRGVGRVRAGAVSGWAAGEELGWRGFALPRLQQHRNALDASILLGLVWGLWHLPLYFVLGTGQSAMLSAGTSPAFAIGGFLGWTIGLSVLFTWLFNQTGGSLIVVILFHAAVNLAAFLPTAVGSGGAASLLNVLITWLVAIWVVVRYGRARLASPPRVEVATAR